MAQILKFPAPASKLGYTRVKRRRSPESRNQLDLFPRATAQVLDMEFGLSRFEQALLLDERGDAQAADFYAQAIEQQDCVADAYCNLGIIESQNGNRIKAFDNFTNSLKHDPRHVQAHYNLGNLYFDGDDLRLAQIHYQIATEVEPSFANSYFNLALVQAIQNNFEAAASALSHYRELVSAEEARIAEGLIQNLKESFSAAKTPKNSRVASR